MIKLTNEQQNNIKTNLDRWDYMMHQFYEGEEDDFMDWFLKNAVKFDLSQTVYEDDILKDSEIIANRCFGNSQYIAHKYKLEYIEGFIFYDPYGVYIPHGFNVKNEKAEDYTLAKYWE